MKRLLFLAITLVSMEANSQLLVNVQLPPTGVVQKTQLWNMAVTNPGHWPLQIHVELMLTDANNSTQVLSAVTRTFIVNPGSSQYNQSSFMPIQYNAASPSYMIDLSPNGLLPAGTYNVCYSFMVHNSDVIEKVAEECQEIRIEPLAPPQLVMPYDQSVVDVKNPQFSWIPPMPATNFMNLKYDLQLVEVYPTQTPSDAAQQNIPLFTQFGISNTNLLYPASAPILNVNKQYAWRVTAKNAESPIGQSETWSFTLKPLANTSDNKNLLPYAKLKKEESGYAIFNGELKFDYINEVGDTTWNLTVQDLNVKEKRVFQLNMDSTKLKAGQNLVRVDVTNNKDFIEKHIYKLEVTNSRKEVYKLKFEYRKPE